MEKLIIAKSLKFHLLLAILLFVMILVPACLKKKTLNIELDIQQQQTEQKGNEEFSYLFERRGRRNPYIGVGVYQPKPMEISKEPKSKQEQINQEVSTVTQNEQIQPTIKRWPSDPEYTKLMKDVYKKLNEVAGQFYEDIMDLFENFDTISDDEFVKIFTNIYVLYKFYYQSKRGENLKKYTKVLKSYIKEIESIFNPIQYMSEYLEEVFNYLKKDLVIAQSKPSIFKDLQEDMAFAKKLLYNPLLTIRKKIFIEFIEKIRTNQRKNYRKLEEKIKLYTSMYNDFKTAGLSISGYIYNPENIQENTIFVGDKILKAGDMLWENNRILSIGKGEIEINYKGENLILHFLEE